MEADAFADDVLVQIVRVKHVVGEDAFVLDNLGFIVGFVDAFVVKRTFFVVKGGVVFRVPDFVESKLLSHFFDVVMVFFKREFDMFGD